MGWQDAPIVEAAPKREAWEAAPIVAPSALPQPARGVIGGFAAGYQGSATGLALRGKLPDLVLDAHDSRWYERAAAGLAQIGAELPLSVAGAIGGAMAGAATTANPIGALIGGGAGGMAIPAAIRQAYIEALTKGEITGTADFLNRTAIVLKQTAKEGLIGAATMGAGKAAGVGLKAAGAGAATTAVGTLAAEGATMVGVSAALEGKMPEPQDFMDAAILLGGLKGSVVIAGRMRDIYAKTGKTPMEVAADASRDPELKAELLAPEPEVKPSASEPAKPAKAGDPPYDPEARVALQAFDRETGGMAETTMTAREALADNAKRRKQMEDLLTCLRG